MKTLRRLWAWFGLCEKISIAIILVGLPIILCICLSWLQCPLCRQELTPGERYFWDVRTGDLLPVSRYLSGQSDIFWFDGSCPIPQEVTPTSRNGCARFPASVTERAAYCPLHRPVFEEPRYFFVLTAGDGENPCCEVCSLSSFSSGKQTVSQRFNDKLNCWEIVVSW